MQACKELTVENSPRGFERDYRLYDATAGTYDQERFGGRAGAWGHWRQVSVLRGMLPDWEGIRVLELGCGTGRITEFLARLGARITATDISVPMLEMAKSRMLGLSGIAVPEFRPMSIYDIDVGTEGYDVILAINVIGRLSDPSGALSGISRAMSEKCRFLFNFPCLTSVLAPFGILVNMRRKSLGRNVTSRWHTPNSILRFCRDADLAVTRWYGNHYVPLPRRLFLTLPLFRACDFLLSERFPRLCPSVFAECRRVLAKSPF